MKLAYVSTHFISTSVRCRTFLSMRFTTHLKGPTSILIILLQHHCIPAIPSHVHYLAPPLSYGSASWSSPAAHLTPAQCRQPEHSRSKDTLTFHNAPSFPLAPLDIIPLLWISYVVSRQKFRFSATRPLNPHSPPIFSSIPHCMA